MTFTNDASTLIINNADSNDLGFYRCKINVKSKSNDGTEKVIYQKWKKHELKADPIKSSITPVRRSDAAPLKRQASEEELDENEVEQIDSSSDTNDTPRLTLTVTSRNRDGIATLTCESSTPLSAPLEYFTWAKQTNKKWKTIIVQPTPITVKN
jgi:hypothetical protein